MFCSERSGTGEKKTDGRSDPAVCALVPVRNPYFFWLLSSSRMEVRSSSVVGPAGSSAAASSSSFFFMAALASSEALLAAFMIEKITKAMTRKLMTVPIKVGSLTVE